MRNSKVLFIGFQMLVSQLPTSYSASHWKLDTHNSQNYSCWILNLNFYYFWNIFFSTTISGTNNVNNPLMSHNKKQLTTINSKFINILSGRHFWFRRNSSIFAKNTRRPRKFFYRLHHLRSTSQWSKVASHIGDYRYNDDGWNVIVLILLRESHSE